MVRLGFTRARPGTRPTPLGRALLPPLLLLALLAPAADAHAAPTVYAAASLRSAFPEIDGAARYNFAGSNTLQRQIEQGAPADVFAAASPDEARALFRAGRCTRPVTFATNVLVMLVPRSNPARLRSIHSLRSGGRRIAVGAVGVPVGDYTRQVLRRLRLTSILERNVVSLEPDVAGITAKVALASADAGFAYRTDARTAGDRVRAIGIPRRAQPPIRYQLCAVRREGADSAGAQAFIRRVVGPRGRRVLRRWGFGLPPRG